MAAGLHQAVGSNAGAQGCISNGDQAKRGAAETGGMAPRAPVTRGLLSATITLLALTFYKTQWKSQSTVTEPTKLLRKNNNIIHLPSYKHTI